LEDNHSKSTVFEVAGSTVTNMSKINPQDVMALRQKSGLGLMECKAALEEADGDMALAEVNLRKKGLSKMDGYVDRESAEGCVAVAFTSDHSRCAIVQVNTETDFTAKNDAFIAAADDVARMALTQPAGVVEPTSEMRTRIDELRITTKENVKWRRGCAFEGGRLGTYIHHDRKIGVVVQIDGDINDDVLHRLCLHVASVFPAPAGVNDDDVPDELIAKERNIAKAQAMESGKPEHIAEKMVDGKIRKYLNSVVLIRQSLVMDDGTQVKDLLPSGTSIRQFVKYRVGE
jgi:elongation factor Ts